VAEWQASGFGPLLRRLRAEAGLTQEQLADAAQVSPRTVSDLERGISATARLHTARVLADALGLAGSQRRMFEAAARGWSDGETAGSGPDAVSAGGFPVAATQTLPRDIAAFTGRAAELARLADDVDEAVPASVVQIVAVGGMAGIGKTTLSVHAAHQLAPRFADGQYFVPLHGHTPGQPATDPAEALADLLLSTGLPGPQIPAGLDARAARWRDYLAGKRTLLVLDDAAGHDQVRPLLPGTAGSLVLITSRKRLSALEDASVIDLDGLPPSEAAELFVRLAGRPGLDRGDAAVAEITRLCGYLPLAIGMLARQLHHHPAWTAASLAADLTAARHRLELMHTEDMSVAAAFDLSYRELTAGQRRFFRRLGLHPGTDIDAHAAAALTGIGLPTARRYLGSLYDHRLITEPARGRYRLHDLLREHARTLAAADDPAAREAATRRLLDYYLHTALAASRHIVRDLAGRSLPTAQPPRCAPALSTPEHSAQWLEAERANLHAAASHAAAHGYQWHAAAIPAAISGFLRASGHWGHQGLALHQRALTAARAADDLPGQARALNLLGNMQRLAGDYPASAATQQQALELYRDLGDLPGQADALNQLGLVQQEAGNYPEAAASHQAALAIARQAGDLTYQAHSVHNMAAIQKLRGDHLAAAAGYRQALTLFRATSHPTGEGSALLQLGILHRLAGDYPAAAARHREALAVYRAIIHRLGEAETLRELGVVHRLAGDYLAATASQQQALEQFRDLDERAGQAYALTEIGLVQQLTGNCEAATASHQQALVLFRDADERIGQAEALNNLAELLSAPATARQARDCHDQALAIARELGAPLEEARALEGIGRCRLQDRDAREAAAALQQALCIYQTIGAAVSARRVQATIAAQHAEKDAVAFP
jgi:tetratricopeptide (TPR) repeat protein/transcriptional regulator with XRE-family HTH domain